MASEAAPYDHPKLLAIAYVQPQRHSLDLTKLTDDELRSLTRITAKAQR
jgi:diadenosine tetraphosphate (Ap4A) HIT family hydrolase